MEKKSITVVGGDLRIVKLIEMLINDGYKVYTYALENSEELLSFDSVEMCPTLEEAVSYSKVIVGPVPLSSDRKRLSAPFGRNYVELPDFVKALKGKYLIAGNIGIKDELDEKGIQFTDLLKREEFSVLNTIATAEGTIEIIIENTNKILHGSNVLILGFGRIGKVLARKLAGLSARVTCAARKDEDLAWIHAYGHRATNINTIGENLSEFDVIINTVPHMVLTEERLQYVKKHCLLIDLASNPGGIDKRAVKENNLKFVWALSLPGKVAPTTSAEFIKDTIYNILKEIYK